MVNKNYCAALIFDIGLNGFEDGRLFDRKYAILPGLGYFPILAEKARHENIVCLTIDQYLANRTIYKDLPKYGYTYEAKPHTNKILEKENITKFITYCGEAPLNSVSFYREINSRVQGYQHLFIFSGTRLQTNLTTTRVHDFFWPNTDIPLQGKDWDKRRLLAFISSPKSKYPANFERLLSRLARYPRHIFRSLSDTLFGHAYGKHLCISLTQYRRDVIRYFGPHKEFQLYGKGWMAAIRHDREFSKFIYANPPASLDNKHLEVGNYKYIICFENTIFQGYITEKIFDAMLGGAVPIWRGCDDIYNYVPAECFIDAKDFPTFRELHDYLLSKTKEEWLAYREAIDNYLKSERYTWFTGEYFATKVIRLLKESLSSR